MGAGFASARPTSIHWAWPSITSWTRSSRTVSSPRRPSGCSSRTSRFRVKYCFDGSAAGPSGGREDGMTGGRGFDGVRSRAVRDFLSSRPPVLLASCLLAVLLSSLPVLPSSRLSAQVDTIDRPKALFTWRDGLLAAGFAVGTVAIRPIDESAAQSLQRPWSQENRWLQRSAVGFRTIAVPGAVIIGVSMYTAGRISKNDRLADLGLHG